jgi:hypothetical protein
MTQQGLVLNISAWSLEESDRMGLTSKSWGISSNIAYGQSNKHQAIPHRTGYMETSIFPVGARSQLGYNLQP